MSIGMFQRLALLKVYDASSGTLRPAAEVNANIVAVSQQRAAILTPEGNGGATATDLNLDGDRADEVTQLYDGNTDTRYPLGVAANSVAIPSDLMAITVPEAGEAGLDRNGDGDLSDNVLAVVRFGGSPSVDDLGVAADAIGVTASTVVFTTPEADDAATDLNGDSDTDDNVVRLYDDTTGEVTEVGMAAEEFVVGDSIVAFRTSEAAQDDTDLNGDGDTLDAVMQVYDPSRGVVVTTGQAAIRCTLPGCDPFQPYKVKGDSVSFITREADQGNQDLNGDLDADDTVLQVFNVRNGTLQVFDLSGGVPLLDPLPQEQLGGTVLYVEGEDTEDINSNGDTDDLVVYVVGDADEDGTFNDSDTCFEASNPAQDDSDLDGLGNTCDSTAFCSEFVPPAPQVAAQAALECQKAIGKAVATYVGRRASAVTKCLDGIAKGKLLGDPVTLCRGGFSGALETPPRDGKTGAKLAKAAGKLVGQVGGKCADAEVGLLDSCAVTVSDLPRCLLPASGEAVNASSDLAYGAVGGIADNGVRRCQAAAGKASGKYLKAVVKAIAKCLDQFNAGKISGNSQVLCLGALTPGGVVLPTETKTNKKVEKAEMKLRLDIGKKCPGSELAGIDVCTGSVAEANGASNCLVCTHWRRAVEAIRSAYGPQ